MPEGLKLDKGKDRWDLVPWKEFEEVVKVLTLGASKYAPNNWKKVENARDRYFAATLRHLIEWEKGNKKDDETNLSHLSHAICNLLFLMWFDNRDIKGG